MQIHRIPPNLFCVPAALFALTGDDIESVITPALNRHALRGQTANILDTVSTSHMSTATAVLEERGYNVRCYRSDAPSGALRAHIATWAKRSLKWPGRALLIATATHCLVISDGKVYDNWTPFGVEGAVHPFANTTVTWAALVEKGS
jgi:hypothetical protein